MSWDAKCWMTECNASHSQSISQSQAGPKLSESQSIDKNSNPSLTFITDLLWLDRQSITSGSHVVFWVPSHTAGWVHYAHLTLAVKLSQRESTAQKVFQCSVSTSLTMGDICRYSKNGNAIEIDCQLGQTIEISSIHNTHSEHTIRLFGMKP